VSVGGRRRRELQCVIRRRQNGTCRYVRVCGIAHVHTDVRPLSVAFLFTKRATRVFIYSFAGGTGRCTRRSRTLSTVNNVRRPCSLSAIFTATTALPVPPLLTRLIRRDLRADTVTPLVKYARSIPVLAVPDKTRCPNTFPFAKTL